MLALKRRIESLLAVPTYLTLKESRRLSLTMPRAELVSRRRKALEARRDLLELLQSLARRPDLRRALHAALGDRGVQEVARGLERSFADLRSRDALERAQRLWRSP